MFNVGPLELMVILLLALVVVGPSRLPEVGRSIGKGLREFRKVQDEVRDSINFNLDEPIRPTPAPTPRAPRTPEPSVSPVGADDPNPTPPAAAGPVPEAAGAASEDVPHAVGAPDGPPDASGESVDPATPGTGSANGSTPGPEISQE